MGFKDEGKSETTAEAAPEGGGYAQGSDYKPAGAAAKGIPLDAKLHPDFRLLYHPLRWDWFQSADGNAGEWLPLLRSLPLTAGVDNVDKDNDPSMAIGIAAQGGWTAIYPSAQDPYIIQHEALGGVAHFSRWERLKVLGTRVFFSSDESGYRAWLRDLCKRQGWKPDADVIAMKRAQFEAELQMDGGDTTNPKATARAKNTQRILDAIDGKKPAKKAAAPAGEGA
jgi:hypothetical protein